MKIIVGSQLKYDCDDQNKRAQKMSWKNVALRFVLRWKMIMYWKQKRPFWKIVEESLHEKIRSCPYWVLCMETIFYSKLGKEFIDSYLRGVSSSQKHLILPKSLRQVKVNWIRTYYCFNFVNCTGFDTDTDTIVLYNYFQRKKSFSSLQASLV